MMFDAQVQVAAIDITSGEDHVQMIFVPAMTLSTSQGPTVLPTGMIRIPVSKEKALEISDMLKKIAEDLPDPKPESDLVVAQSLSGVDQAANLNKKIKGQ